MFICLSHWEKRNIRQVADCSKVPGFLATSFETWSKDITQTHLSDMLAHRRMVHAGVGRGMDGQVWFSSSVLQRARDFILCAFLPLPPANLGNRLPSWPQGCPVSVSYPSLQQNTWNEELKRKKNLFWIIISRLWATWPHRLGLVVSQKIELRTQVGEKLFPLWWPGKHLASIIVSPSISYTYKPQTY